MASDLDQGESIPLARAAIVEIPPLNGTGIYEIIDQTQVIDRFALNFHDLEESTLTDLRAGIRAPESPMLTSAYSIDSHYSWIVAFGIAAIMLVALLDWHLLQPKGLPSKP